MSPYFPWTLAILIVVVVIASVVSGAPERYGIDLLRCRDEECKPKPKPCAANNNCNQKPKDDCGCNNDEDDDDDGGCECNQKPQNDCGCDDDDDGGCGCNKKPQNDCGCDDDDDDDGGCSCRRNLRTLSANPPSFVDYYSDWGFRSSRRRNRARRQANLTPLRTKGVATALVKSHEMKKVRDKV